MRALLTSTLLFFSLGLMAQSPKQWAKYGNEAFDEGDFYGAAYYFKKAVNTDTAYLEGYWMMAESYRMYNHYSLALETYQLVFERDIEETYYKAAFYIPLMQKSLEQYSDAKEGFENYLKVYRSRSTSLSKRAKQEIKSCTFALENNLPDSTFETVHLNQPTNSFDGEIAPWLSNDSSLYFHSLRFSDTATKTTEKPAFFSYYKSSDDSLEILDSLFSKGDSHLVNVHVSPLRPRVYYSLCNDEACQIYYRDSTSNGMLDESILIEALSVSGYTSTQPNAAKWGDKEVLLFTSNRPRGKGGMDIWYSEIKDGNKFGRPKNLGKKINTPENEITPFYLADSGLLYFSSTWHEGYGGYDIQKSKGSLKSWAEPKNAGKPINSPSNDLYYSYHDSLQTALWISNRTGSFALKGEHCCNDIYMGRYSYETEAIIPTDTPKVVEPDTPKAEIPILAFSHVTIYFDNDQPNPKSWKSTTNTSLVSLVSNYEQQLREYITYQEDSMAFESFTASSINGILQRINQLKTEIETALEQGDTLEIILNGYASPLAKTDYNLNLSKRRIHAVKTHLLESEIILKGVEANRVLIIENPLGESESNLKVSDDLGNKQLSVYSLEAMTERRVSISVKRR